MGHILDHRFDPSMFVTVGCIVETGFSDYSYCWDCSGCMFWPGNAEHVLPPGPTPRSPPSSPQTPYVPGMGVFGTPPRECPALGLARTDHRVPSEPAA